VRKEQFVGWIMIGHGDFIELYGTCPYIFYLVRGWAFAFKNLVFI
jgi:hypothetical protein